MTLEDWVRARFWELQIPALVTSSPGGGIDAHTDFGETLHFHTETDVQFFLAGYRLGEKVASEPPPETGSPNDEGDQGAQGGA